MNVVWFAEIKWDYLRTRKQHLIQRRPPAVDVLFLEPFVKGRANESALRQVDGIKVATVPFAKSVPAGPLRTALNLRSIRRLADHNARRTVTKLLRAAEIDPSQSLFVISNVYAIDVASSIPHARLIYDCNDAHSAFPGMPAWTRRYQEETCRRADLVTASSVALRDDVAAIRGGSEGVELVGNGVDFARFAAAANEHPPDGPVIGYLGAIAPWLDFELLESLARARSDWRFVLVGPSIGDVDRQRESLARLENVEVLPPVGYEEVPSVMAGFTVGIIPFVRDELTRGVNPNKLYEYLAAGVPVVATDFSPEVRRYSGVVRSTNDASEFENACEQFVSRRSSPESSRELREIAAGVARENDWDAVAEAFWSEVERRAGGFR